MIKRDELLKELIGFRTVNPPGSEIELCRYLEKELKAIGFETTLQDLGNNRANIIAEIGPENSKVSLMLTGHIDVVGVEEGWESDPFELTQKGGKLFGRGTCDMKGAVAAMISAAADIIKTGVKFKNKLVLAFVADEEVGGSGSRKLLASGITANYAVIGEPTMMNVAIAHRGVDRNIIVVEGRAGHASDPDKSVNPIYTAAEIILKIQEKHKELQKKEHFILPPPSIAATVVNGGIQSNVIPRSCEIIVDRRTIPGEDGEFVAEELRKILEEVSGKYPECTAQIENLGILPASEPKSETTLDKTSYEILKKMGLDISIKDFPAGCDQHQFVSSGIETILVGPGNLEQAHTANEYVSVEQMDKAEMFYRNLIKELLF